MQSFAVTLHLCENKYRQLSKYLPYGAGIYTLIVKAESYASAIESVSTIDCMKVEITQVTHSETNE